MSIRRKKSVKLRVLATFATIAFVGAIFYGFVVGFNAATGMVIAASLVGLGAPAVSAGEGFLDVVAGFFDMLLEGLMSAITGIFEIIGSLFSG